MKLIYDLRQPTAYLRIRERPATVETVHVSDELDVEVAPDGTVCGIKFLKAQQQLAGTDQGQFVFLDEAKGQERKVPISLEVSSTIRGAPFWHLKIRGTPLSEAQEALLRMHEVEGLTHKEIAERSGVTPLRVRHMYEATKALQQDYARHGVDSMLLLPARVLRALQMLNLTSRAQVKLAIVTGEIRWDTQLHRVIRKKNRYGTDLGQESWLLLLEWAAEE